MRVPNKDDQDHEEQNWDDLILESPNGTLFKLLVDDNGVLSTEEITE
jgi:hypothetical protein